MAGTAKWGFNFAVKKLRALDMPVGLFETIVEHGKTFWGYEIDIAPFSSISYVNPSLNTLNFTKDVYDQFWNFEIGGQIGEATAVQTLYHEATHALLDIKADDKKFKDFIKKGEEHYKNAPLKGTSETGDGHRVFHEAFSSYVGHRAASVYGAHDWAEVLMGILREKFDAGETDQPSWFDFIEERANAIAKDYNSAMKQRVFGYDEVSGGQQSTTRPLSDELRAFCDDVILEGKIPDLFSANVDLVDRVRRLKERIAWQRDVIPITIVD